MNFILWLVLGGVIGWLASMAINRGTRREAPLNVFVGVAGALIGGWLLSPLLGVGTTNQYYFSGPSLALSLIGAVSLLAVINVLRRRQLP